MGIFSSKIGGSHLETSHDSNTLSSRDINTAVSSQEIIDWEQIYKKRFARKFIFSTYTQEPLFNLLWKPTTNLRWQDRLDTNIRWNQCNPRYAGPTPEPLTTELSLRTRHELRVGYRRHLIEVGLRRWLKEAWLGRWCLVVRVPHLCDDVDFPPASEIKNGYILPARIRAHILGHSGGLPVHKDSFLVERLRGKALFLGLSHPSQVPYEDDLLSNGSWLNQTTAVYFEPQFRERDLDWIGRGLFAAWREVDEARGETPNLQQMRYFASPVMLAGGPDRRPIADVVATHNRICEALADAQDKPVGPKDPYSWVEHGAEMGAVYRSIIIVVDKDQVRRKGENEAEYRDIMFEQSSALLVRTGNEAHLSEPIDFSELGCAILPLGIDEALLDNQQVVRVRVRTAVRFIMDLERRERDRSPRLTAMKKILDDETFREADAFATEALELAKRNGSIDRGWDTWEAVRRARAFLDGEPFYVDEELAKLDEENRDLHRWY